MCLNRVLKVTSTLHLDDYTNDNFTDVDEFSRSNKFIGVQLFLDNKPEVFNFYKVEDLIYHSKNRDNYFHFYENAEGRIYILHINENNIVGGKNIYSVELDFEFFINSISNVVVQRVKNGISRSYFDLSKDDNYYISLAILYYIVRNYDHIGGKEIKNKYKDLQEILYKS